MSTIVLMDNLYISSKITDPKKAIANILGDNFSGDEFLICLNNASPNLMDIYYVKELKKPYIKIDNLTVLAVCRNKEDSKEICRFIIECFMLKYNSISDFKSKVCLIRWGKDD